MWITLGVGCSRVFVSSSSLKRSQIIHHSNVNFSSVRPLLSRMFAQTNSDHGLQQSVDAKSNLCPLAIVNSLYNLGLTDMKMTGNVAAAKVRLNK